MHFCDLRVYTPCAAVLASPGAISVVSAGYWKVLKDFRASGSPLDALTVCYPTDQRQGWAAILLMKQASTSASRESDVC